MDWIEFGLKALVAVAAIAGAIAAIFKWLTERRSRISAGSNLDHSANKGASIKAGRDVNTISNSFNRTVGGSDGG
jgi:hypothetical protein